MCVCVCVLHSIEQVKFYFIGEEKFSYGYGGTAKASTNNNFENYGQKFRDGDVITAYLVSVPL